MQFVNQRAPQYVYGKLHRRKRDSIVLDYKRENRVLMDKRGELHRGEGTYKKEVEKYCKKIIKFIQAEHILLKDNILAACGQYKPLTKNDLGTDKRKQTRLLETDGKLYKAVNIKFTKL